MLLYLHLASLDESATFLDHAQGLCRSIRARANVLIAKVDEEEGLDEFEDESERGEENESEDEGDGDEEGSDEGENDEDGSGADEE